MQVVTFRDGPTHEPPLPAPSWHRNFPSAFGAVPLAPKRHAPP
jgi:hypothetical protein